MSKVEDKLAELGLTLPDHVPPSGSYLVGYRAGNLVFTSAVGPRSADSNITGSLGDDCSIEQGYEAARRTCLRMLTNVKSIIGDLDKIVHVVKILGMVQATPDFNGYAQVVNGCSDLLVELYGEAGKHARSSMGVVRNPFDGVVSIDGVFEVRD
ncbi:MAG: RidA family protein [Chloroflexi bacterium]|nr:RidA family protein [Chloroflexota bacterium]